MSFTSFVVLFHSFVYAHVCGLSGHFPFLFVVPLAYSFIASSLTPHLIIHHKTQFISCIFINNNIMISCNLMPLVFTVFFTLVYHSMTIECVLTVHNVLFINFCIINFLFTSIFLDNIQSLQ